jgi:adenine phosphoribosyltransferase
MSLARRHELRLGGQREEERRVSGDNSDLKALIRTIPDYPKPGIMFRDITTLIGNAEGFRTAIRQLAAPFENTRIDAVAGIEARGFIVGGAVADRLGTGFIPIRKKGKLPWKAIGQEYQLEYGVDIIEMHEDAIRTGERVLIVDDLIATGGTVEAAVKLIRRLGGVVVGAAFLIDLPEIGGAKRLESEHQVRSHILMTFEGH